MALKSRVLYFSSKAKMKSFANEICAKIDCKSDMIPPAYPCEKERIVYIGASIGKDIPNPLRLFAQSIDKTRAANVALFIDGPKEAADELANILRTAGTNVMSEYLFVKGGIPFLGGMKDEEKKAIDDWALKLFKEVENA